MTFRLKRDTVTDLELQHLGVRAHLMNEPQPLDDPVVEVDELGLGEPVDVDAHSHSRGRRFLRPSGLERPPNARGWPDERVAVAEKGALARRRGERIPRAPGATGEAAPGAGSWQV